MRVLLLSHSPNDENAGASRIYHMLATGLRSRGHEVDLFHLEDMRLPRDRRIGRAAQRVLMPRYVSRFGARQLARGYDVVMASSGMAAPLFERLRARTGRPLLVNHLHGLAIYDHLAAMTEATLGHYRATTVSRLVTGPIQARWDDRGIRAADLTIVQNRRDLAEVRRRLPGPAAVTMIPAAIHPSLLAVSATVTPSDRRRPEIVWFAAWQPRKGSAYLPGAFRIVRASRPDARLVIGGTGRDAADLLGEFAVEDRAAVEVLSRIGVADQAALFDRAAIIVFPSLSEGFGLALAEAMSFGLAAVAGATGFAADFLTDRRDARIVVPSTEHLGHAMLALLEDPDDRGRMAREGRAIARLFTSDRMVLAYERAFRHGSSISSDGGIERG